MNMKLRNIPFSPPDMTEAEAKEVHEAILSGWITTGPRTKKLEQQISEYVHTVFGRLIKEGKVHRLSGQIDELGMSLIANGVKLSPEVERRIKDLF